MPHPTIASIIMAAGRGSRMTGYTGNKTLLPLVPGASPYQGERPMLRHIIDHLPAGPKALILHHDREAVEEATRDLDLAYCLQPQLNGTGGALLAAAGFLESTPAEAILITMGDVPFVRRHTYARLCAALAEHPMVILGFQPPDKKQYGVLEIEAGCVQCITEWKYWKDYPPARRDALTVCNAGIYAVRRDTLLAYLPVLAAHPQQVTKEIGGRRVTFDEYFFTDIIAPMVGDGLPVGYRLTDDPEETMGIDDPDALRTAQQRYRHRC